MSSFDQKKSTIFSIKSIFGDYAYMRNDGNRNIFTFKNVSTGIGIAIVILLISYRLGWISFDQLVILYDKFKSLWQ